MTSNDKKDTPAATAKAEPLKDTELDQVTGGVWGLESNFVKAPVGDTSVSPTAQTNSSKTGK